MDLGVISIRYARALHKSAMQAGCDEAVCHDMTALLKAYTQLPQLRQTIESIIQFVQTAAQSDAASPAA